MAATLPFVLAMLFAVVGWCGYFRERERSRDYATDLAQVIHDHDLDRDDLRRSLGWKEIEDRVDE